MGYIVEMRDGLNVLTKYFACKDLEHVKSGSIKFGTLFEYRGVEASDSAASIRMDRMSDAGEGRGAVSLDISGRERLGTFRTPGLNIVGGRSGPNTKLVLHHEANAWVFCSTFGPYSREHHEVMKARNPDLTHYAVIEVGPLCRALMDVWKAQFTRTDFPSGIDFIVADLVKYEGRTEFRVANESEGRSRGGLDYGQYLRTVFHKPKRFEHEREFRILANILAPRTPERNAPPEFPASYAIRKAIKCCGAL